MKIEINDKVYDVRVAETDADFESGLQDITSLPENEGMLFPYEEEEEVTFWMKDTLIPLDIIFVNECFSIKFRILFVLACTYVISETSLDKFMICDTAMIFL